METTTLPHTLTPTAYRNYMSEGADYPTYIAEMQAKIASGVQDHYSQYLPMNWQRMSRLQKTVVLTPAVQGALQAMHPQHWLVISEHWCGDASQILPVLNAIAEASAGKINLRIAYRDDNLPLIDAHLTGTSRSIPKLIVLNSAFEVLTTWGPRPAAAQEMVLRLKADPETAATYSEHLHKWYATNKTAATQAELLPLLAL